MTNPLHRMLAERTTDDMLTFLAPRVHALYEKYQWSAEELEDVLTMIGEYSAETVELVAGFLAEAAEDAVRRLKGRL